TYAVVGNDPPSGYAISRIDARTAAPVTTFGRPGQVHDITAVPGNGRVTVSWSPPDSTGGLPVTGYVVTSDQGVVVEAGADATGTVITGLTNGASYQYQVQARSRAGL